MVKETKFGKKSRKQNGERRQSHRREGRGRTIQGGSTKKQGPQETDPKKISNKRANRPGKRNNFKTAGPNVGRKETEVETTGTGSHDSLTDCLHRKGRGSRTNVGV